MLELFLWRVYLVAMEMNPQSWLEAEYLRRKKANPAFSLRSFARILEIPSGRLSQLFSRKRNLTPSLGRKIALRLHLDPNKTQQLLKSIEVERKLRRKNHISSIVYEPLDMDQFQTIADPLHFSILSLLETKDFLATVPAIARRLQIDSVEARAAVERLRRLGLIAGEAEIRLVKAAGLTTSHDVSNSALQLAHKKVLEESIEALEAVAVEDRDITSITMAIDPKKIPEAKKRIRDFRRTLCDFLESGERTEVYRLNIQVIPLTMRKKI